MTAKPRTKQLRLPQEKISELTQSTKDQKDKRRKMLLEEEARIRREREATEPVRPEYRALTLAAMSATTRGTPLSGLVEGLLGINTDEGDPEGKTTI